MIEYKIWFRVQLADHVRTTNHPHVGYESSMSPIKDFFWSVLDTGVNPGG